MTRKQRRRCVDVLDAPLSPGWCRVVLRAGAILTLGVIACAGSPPAVPTPEPGSSVVPMPRDNPDPSARVLPAQLPAQPPRDLVIGIEDLVEVKVFEAPDMDRTLRVAADGTLTLPLLGPVEAAGFTVRELESALEDRLRGSYIIDPHVSVVVQEVMSQPVYVLGSVQAPGVFQIRGVSTVLEVLAMAGGLTAEAGNRVVLMRPEAGAGPDAVAGDVFEVDLGRLLAGADPGLNLSVRPGDIVKVQEAGLVYVVGEVRRPGAFPLPGSGGVSVLQAVALGEGLLPNAARGSALIIRTDGNSQRTETPVDLGAVISGEQADVTLHENDILFVPKSGARSLASGLFNAFVRTVTLRAFF